MVYYILAGYIILILLAFIIQDRFIWKPEKLRPDFTFHYDQPFEELFFDPEPGVRLNGLHFQVTEPQGLLLYFHGNTRSIKGWGKYARDYTRHGYDVLMVDYRGFGKSTGKRSETQLLKDAQFVYDEQLKKYPEHHILVYGRSMGSGFAVKLACDNRPRYCILHAPYYSFTRVVKRFLPILPVTWVLKYHLRADRWIRKVNCHTYILHGTKDRLIPIRHSESLRSLNPDKVTLIRIQGGGHNNLPSFPEYHTFIRDILQE